MCCSEQCDGTSCHPALLYLESMLYMNTHASHSVGISVIRSIACEPRACFQKTLILLNDATFTMLLLQYIITVLLYYQLLESLTCLIYKLNFIKGKYIQEKSQYIYMVRYYPQFQAPWNICPMDKGDCLLPVTMTQVLLKLERPRFKSCNFPVLGK